MQKTLIVLLSITLSGSTWAAADDAKAAALMAAARAFIGGEAALARIQALTLSGTFRREAGDRQMTGDLSLDFAWPDRMQRTETSSPIGDATIISTLGINGERLIRNSRTIGGGNLLLRTAPAGGPDAEAQALRNQRAEMARLTIALLMTSMSLPVEYAYGGEADAPDGKADVVDVTGPGSFALRLFLNKSDHRPLLLQYRGVVPRLVMQTRPMRSAPEVRGQASDLPPLPPAEPVDISLFLDDYREVAGVRFPHRISRSLADVPNEEWTIERVTINPSFKADTFGGPQ